jgi:hypothetical protein
MANRVLTVDDLLSIPWMVPSGAYVGDILQETPTGTHADGKVQFRLENGSTFFAGARLGANIWVDGAQGTFYDWRLRGNLDGDMAEWAEISDQWNYVHIKPVPGTQVKVERNLSSNGGYLFLVSNIKFYVIDGENNAYPGLRDGWPGTFLTGHFGFFFTNGIYPIGGHTLAISAPDGGHAIVRGTEHQGGFSAVRFQAGNYYGTVKITLERIYMHDAGDGEGAYLGATHALPYCLLKVIIRDVVIANRACEGIQIQHIISGVGENMIVEHFVNFCPAMDGMKAFQGGQDTANQLSVADGGCIFRNGITDGSAFSSVAANHFGTTDHPADPINPEPFRIKNVLFHNIGGILSYLHNSNTDGVPKVMEEVYCINFSNRYYHDGLNDVADYYVSAHNGTNPFSFINCVHDGVKSQFFQNPAGFEVINIRQETLPPPVYVNSGFFEPSSDIMNFKKTYANYHDDDTLDKPVRYLKGWVVVNIEQGMEYAYYLIINEHTTAGLDAPNPRQHILANGNIWYAKLTWDANGKRNLLTNGDENPEWNGALAQSLIPPHDLRLVADNYWNKKGMGLLSNLPNTDYTQFTWFRNSTPSLSGAVQIPGSKTKYYTPQECDRGKYLTMGFKRKDNTGIWDPDWIISNWTLVN